MWKSCFFLIVSSILAFSVNSNASERAKPYMPTDGRTCFHAGPQSPRDIHEFKGINPSIWPEALTAEKMNLCNIHFHRFAEHRGPNFSKKLGKGVHQGYVCNKSNRKRLMNMHRDNAHGGCHDIAVGDTVEVHWVFTSCEVEPGQTLAACMNPNCKNPNLRVEARVFVLTEGQKDSLNFENYRVKGHHPKSLPVSKDMVTYLGSTTGPKFNNHTCSPWQVTWHVGSECLSLDKSSLDHWCENNVFGEKHAHGVRELVTSPSNLSKIELPTH